ncbi:MAG: hypothetical protein KJZ73_13085 [Pseudorhodoplanes sp.]|nr:hypothetical protein [Pseudorhodoplanes sp.]
MVNKIFRDRDTLAVETNALLSFKKGGGRLIFVDPANGDDAYNGLDPDNPLDTLAAAHDMATAGKNDIVVLIGDGSTTATARLTEQLVWSKNATHLIGVTAPTPIASRARISHAATAPTTAFNMVKVTASGCRFENLSLFEGFNEAAACVLWEDQGARNYYNRVHFGGMGLDAKSADNASSADLLLTGGGEHYFERCAIGLDTVERGAANANIRFRSQVGRVIFDDCWLLASADAATPLFVDANAANALNRWVMFNRCHFLNGLNYGPATTLTAAIAAHANANGTILLNNCSKLNTTDWTASDSALVKLANMPATSGDTGGEYVSSDAT